MYAVRAAQIGLAEGVTWLLHIDADELFYDSNAEELDGSAAKVFEALSRKEFTHASFFNDEILPESASYTDKKQLMTPFHQRTLFKVLRVVGSAFIITYFIEKYRSNIR